MTPDQLRPLVAYNHWANERFLRAAAAVSAEERTRDLRASFTSLHGTLVHILWAERGWLHFWQAGGFLDEPAATAADDLDFARLQLAWTRHSEAYAAYLLNLSPADLDAPRRVDDDGYVLSDLVEHTLNHSTYHRGQVALLLRQLGHEPPETGYRQFLTGWRGQEVHEVHRFMGS